MIIKIFDKDKNVIQNLNDGNPWRVDTNATDIPSPNTTLYFGSDDELTDVEIQPRVTATLSLVAQKSNTSDLHSAVVSLLKTLRQRDNLLGVDFTGTGSTYYYYHIFPFTAAASKRLLRSWRNASAEKLIVELTLSGYCEGDEETVEIVGDNLLPDPSFETLSGWTKIETGSGTATLTSGGVWGVDFLFGTKALKLTVTGSEDTAGVETTNYISVDNTAHYTIALHTRVVTLPTSSLRVYIAQFDASDTLLATISIPIAMSAGNWTCRPVVTIHPASETSETYCWHPQTQKAKIKILASNGEGSYTVDGAVFVRAAHLTTPLDISLPASAFSGDLPSPAQLIMSPLLDGLFSHRFVVGRRKKYSAGWSATLPAIYGIDTQLPAIPVGGLLAKKIVLSNQLSNPGFEAYTGSGNSTNWNDWTETRSTGALMEADTTHMLFGNACVHFGGTGAASEYPYYASLVSTPISVTGNNNYTLLYFYHMPHPPKDSDAKILAFVSWYTSGGTYIADSPIIPALHPTDDYVPVFGRVRAPSNAATARVKFFCIMHGSSPCTYLDGAWFGETGNTPADIAFATSTVNVAGDCLPISRLALSSAKSTFTIWLANRFGDAAAGICARDRQPVNKLDQDWLRIQFPTMRFPRATAKQQDKEYEIAVIFPTDISGTIYADILTLLPIDGGWIDVAAPSFTIATITTDGAFADDYPLPTIGDYSNLLLVNTAEGLNMCIVSTGEYIYGDRFEHIFLYALTLKYTPRYSLVGS